MFPGESKQYFLHHLMVPRCLLRKLCILGSPEFDAYPFWVAHYYVVRPVTDRQWRFWQFTDRSSVEGIGGYTDFSVFRGTEADFNSLRIK